MNKKMKVIVVSLILAIIGIAVAISCAVYFAVKGPSDDTDTEVEESTEESRDETHRDPIQEDDAYDAYYSVVTRESIKEDFEYDQQKEWMLVTEEDIPIDFDPPEYDPNDHHTYQYQTSYTELDVLVQMTEKYVTKFMTETRESENWEYDPRKITNSYGYYCVSYSIMENAGQGHTTHWRIVVGTVDDTPEEHFTVLVYRADTYTKDESQTTGVRY